LEFAVAHGFVDELQPAEAVDRGRRWRISVGGLVDDGRTLVTVGKGVELDGGEVGRFLAEEDAEQEVEEA